MDSDTIISATTTLSPTLKAISFYTDLWTQSSINEMVKYGLKSELLFETFQKMVGSDLLDNLCLTIFYLRNLLKALKSFV